MRSSARGHREIARPADPVVRRRAGPEPVSGRPPMARRGRGRGERGPALQGVRQRVHPRMTGVEAVVERRCRSFRKPRAIQPRPAHSDRDHRDSWVVACSPSSATCVPVPYRQSSGGDRAPAAAGYRACCRMLSRRCSGAVVSTTQRSWRSTAVPGAVGQQPASAGFPRLCRMLAEDRLNPARPRFAPSAAAPPCVSRPASSFSPRLAGGACSWLFRGIRSPKSRLFAIGRVAAFHGCRRPGNGRATGRRVGGPAAARPSNSGQLVPAAKKNPRQGRRARRVGVAVSEVSARARWLPPGARRAAARRVLPPAASNGHYRSRRPGRDDRARWRCPPRPTVRWFVVLPGPARLSQDDPAGRGAPQVRAAALSRLHLYVVRSRRYRPRIEDLRTRELLNK